MSDQTEPQVKIRRYGAGRWHVTCECSGEDLFSGLFQPWSIAANHQTAMTLAAWHLSLHETCACCGHTPRLDRPEVVDSHTLRYRDDLFVLTAQGVYPSRDVAAAVARGLRSEECA